MGLGQGRNISQLLAWAAALLAAIAAACGLLLKGIYRDVPFWAQQARGIDLATLFLAVPILVIALLLVRRSAIARLGVIGVLLYFVYNYLIYTTSVAMNRLAIVYIAALGVSTWSLVLMLTASPAESWTGRAPTAMPRSAAAWLLLVVAVLFGLLWLGQIASFTFTGVLPSDLSRAKLPANPVYALDLGLFLPLAFVAGMGLLRRKAAGVFAYPMLIWVVLTSAGIAGGFLFESRAGEAAPIPVAVVIIAVAVIAGLLALWPLIRRGGT